MSPRCWCAQVTARLSLLDKFLALKDKFALIREGSIVCAFVLAFAGEPCRIRSSQGTGDHESDALFLTDVSG